MLQAAPAPIVAARATGRALAAAAPYKRIYPAARSIILYIVASYYVI